MAFGIYICLYSSRTNRDEHDYRLSRTNPHIHIYIYIYKQSNTSQHIIIVRPSQSCRFGRVVLRLASDQSSDRPTGLSVRKYTRSQNGNTMPIAIIHPSFVWRKVVKIRDFFSVEIHTRCVHLARSSGWQIRWAESGLEPDKKVCVSDIYRDIRQWVSILKFLNV